MKNLTLKIRKSQFWRDINGGVATTFALASSGIVLAAGVALDTARLNASQTELQAAIDAAALAGAAFDGGNSKQRIEAAKLAFSNNLDTDLVATPPDISVDITGAKLTIASMATVEMGFMGLVGPKSRNVSATAIALWTEAQNPACIIALEPVEKESVVVNSNSDIEAPDCKIQINSANSQALLGNSGGNIVAKETCINGGWRFNSGSSASPPAHNCPALNDPLAGLPAPTNASASCDHTDLVVGGTQTLSPGVYCGKLELENGANVTFEPGIYIKKDGEFIVNAGASAQGAGVMFYLTGTNNSRLNINSGGHIDFSAPMSGTYAGIVFFQERDISSADFSILNSNSSSKIEGVVYLPSTPLHLNSIGNMSATAPWTIIIADKIEVNSHSVLRVNADYASSLVPVPMGLGGSEKSVRLIK